MDTHYAKPNAIEQDISAESEMIRCPKCRNWIECRELADYFCRRCKPLKQEISRIDQYFAQLRDEVFKELER